MRLNKIGIFLYETKYKYWILVRNEMKNLIWNEMKIFNSQTNINFHSEIFMSRKKLSFHAKKISCHK